MKFEFSGAPETPVARPKVWARLMDPKFIAASAPGLENERLKMSARGQGPGSALDVLSAVRLEDTPVGGTRLNWSATSDVSGTVAGVGAKLLEGAARRLTEEFWTG